MGFNHYNKLMRNVLRISRSTTATRKRSGDSFSTISNATSYHLNGGPSYMRGAVFWEPNKPLTFEDFEMPRPKVNEVLIKTKDFLWELVSWVRSLCLVGQDDLCEAFVAYSRAKGTLYDGETRLFLRGSRKPVYMYSMGGLAEYSVVPAHGLAILPQTLPYSESAVIGCAVFTAYGAMAHAAQVRPGDAVAVIGVGGVGLSCLQIARAFGASEIIAVDIQDDKLEKAKLLGATHVVNARTEDAVAKIKDITGGMGVDTCIEALGNPKTFSQCVQSVRDGGKAVMIGLTLSGAKGEIDINHLVRRQIKVMGSYGGRARHDLPKLVKLAESGIFNLDAAVSRKCKFEEAGAAYDDLNKGNIIGRAVVEIM